MLINQLTSATLETLVMVFVSGTLAFFGALPLGVALFFSGHAQPTSLLNRMLGLLINAFRSVPFIILLLALIPLTRWLIGTSIGTTAAVVPLTLAAIPFLARLIEHALRELPTGLHDAANAMGVSRCQLVCKFLLPEAAAGVINALTLTLVNLVSYSAMAGALGGGGLGDLAIRYGYQRFDMFTMFVTIAVLIVLVQGIQVIGDRAARWARKG